MAPLFATESWAKAKRLLMYEGNFYENYFTAFPPYLALSAPLVVCVFLSQHICNWIQVLSIVKGYPSGVIPALSEGKKGVTLVSALRSNPSNGRRVQPCLTRSDLQHGNRGECRRAAVVFKQWHQVHLK